MVDRVPASQERIPHPVNVACFLCSEIKNVTFGVIETHIVLPACQVIQIALDQCPVLVITYHSWCHLQTL